MFKNQDIKSLVLLGHRDNMKWRLSAPQMKTKQKFMP